jgi:hypothetical protein
MYRALSKLVDRSVPLTTMYVIFDRYLLEKPPLLSPARNKTIGITSKTYACGSVRDHGAP